MTLKLNRSESSNGTSKPAGKDGLPLRTNKVKERTDIVRDAVAAVVSGSVETQPACIANGKKTAKEKRVRDVQYFLETIADLQPGASRKTVIIRRKVAEALQEEFLMNPPAGLPHELLAVSTQIWALREGLEGNRTPPKESAHFDRLADEEGDPDVQASEMPHIEQ